ncbi:MAG: GDSL-type esterase/lipase family protein [Bacteroidota bacterium]
MRRLAIVLCLLAVPLAGSVARAGETFPLGGGGIVVMVGDSISTQNLHTNYIEAYVRTRFPQHQYTFHNKSHNGNTASEALARFQDDVTPLHPDVVTVELGTNDAVAGAGAVPGFLACLEEQLRQIRELGASAGVFGPGPVNDNSTTGDMTAMGAVLDVMSYELVALGERIGVPVADQFHPLVDIWGHNYFAADHVDLGGNAVHPGPPGHLTKAWACLRGLGAPSLVSDARINLTQGQVTLAANCEISNLEMSSTHVSFTRMDHTLPMPIPDDARTGLRLIPLAPQLSHYGLRVSGLSEGTYDVKIDGVTVTTATAAELGRSIELGTMSRGPIHDQCQEVLRLIHDEHYVPVGGIGLRSKSAEEELQAAVQPRPHDFVVTRQGEPVPPPTVVKWFPRGAAVSTEAPIIIRFSERMNHASVQNSFSILPETDGEFSWIGCRLTFTPKRSWPANQQYRVTMSAAARSVAGIRLGKAFSWRFTAVEALPTQATVAAFATARGAEIRLGLTGAAAVSVSIRNLAGLEVAALAPGEMKAGIETVLWNGLSKSGTKAPAGVYVVEAVARVRNGSCARAMTMLRRQ